jgi:hypothetical protein
MDCLRSFSIGTKDSAIYVKGGPNAVVKSWTLGTDRYWALNNFRKSIYTIQGFKNINVFGIEMVGDVQTPVNAASGGVIVNDFSFDIYLKGDLPLLNGVISSDYYGLKTSGVTASTFNLTKQTNVVRFADPISSVKEITFSNLYAQGIGGETVDEVAVEWNLDFI